MTFDDDTIDNATQLFLDNVDYWESETKALNCYKALLILSAIRQTGSSINGINMTYSALDNLKTTVENHLKELQHPFMTIASINRYN